MQLLLTLTVLLAAAVAVSAFGIEGHKIIAKVAWELMSDADQKMARHFIRPKDFESISGLPDEYDHSRPGHWSEPLHFVNMPNDAVQYKDEYCTAPNEPAPFCVVAAVRNFTKQLLAEGPNGPECRYRSPDEPCPLEFLVHFVGDAHQPLHVGWDRDRGGNEVRVSFLGERNVHNLHSVWDKGIIEHFQYDYTKYAEFLSQKVQKSPGAVKFYASTMLPSTWANESFEITRMRVYDFFNSTPPMYDDDSSGGGGSSKHRMPVTADDIAQLLALRRDDDGGNTIKLPQSYYDNNLEVVHQRLMAAAVRLATLCKTVFASFGNNSTSGSARHANVDDILRKFTWASPPLHHTSAPVDAAAPRTIRAKVIDVLP